MSTQVPIKVIAKNKRAGFAFELLETFEAGIVLTGTEVKSLRSGKGSLGESYCLFRKGELYIKGMHIQEYSHGNLNNHEPTRERKLLLQKRELAKMLAKVKERGFTIVPVQLYLNERGFIKLDVALARGKTKGDKRQSIKAKDMKREMDKAMKYKR